MLNHEFYYLVVSSGEKYKISSQTIERHFVELTKIIENMQEDESIQKDGDTQNIYLSIARKKDIETIISICESLENKSKFFDYDRNDLDFENIAILYHNAKFLGFEALENAILEHFKNYVLSLKNPKDIYLNIGVKYNLNVMNKLEWQQKIKEDDYLSSIRHMPESDKNGDFIKN